jgi:predicted esterase
MPLLHLPATVHGRVLIDRVDSPRGHIIGLHGYAQVAEDMLVELQQIPGAEHWTKASVQALHPFYTRGDSKVVASWMTRQDRDLAIADNTAYVLDAINAVREHDESTAPLVLVGFSQGTAMAYRAALRCPSPVTAVVALAGDIPPELKSEATLSWPRVLVGVGDREEWYVGPKLEADLAFLRSRNVTHELVRFAGGHEWTADFRAAVGRILANQ